MASRHALRPAKDCPVCGRPFSWRKKWARDWPRVKYCSERCRRQGRTGGPAARTSAR
ncbi:MAG: DUF2256 domain-containing protein [Alphaproteobacteria bacterium]|nr:DUF2256 domain-containing protein [Alphaproteobacteria bacterium]